MKKITLFALTALLAVAMIFSMTSCSPSVEDIKDVLEDWEDDEKIEYDQLKSSEREEFVEEWLDIFEEIDLDVSFQGEITDIFCAESWDEDEVLCILVFEKTSDAKLADDIDLDSIGGEYKDDVQEVVDYYDLTIERKGKVVIIGSKNLVADFLDEL